MTFCGGRDFLLWREKREGNDGKNVLVLVAFLSFFQCSLESRTTRDAQGDRCLACKRTFNERTGTPFNYLEYPTDIVLLVVFWRLRYKLSPRDLFRQRLDALKAMVAMA
jgi:hypothetical protein